MIKQGQMGSGQFVGELSFLNKFETSNAKHLFYWNGKSANELTREELLEALIFMSDELRAVRKDRDRWRNAGDVVSYLAQSDAA